jgi:effector-binding domain-containing protein
MFERQIASLEEQITNLNIQRDSIAAWRGLIHEERSAMAQAEFQVSHRWYDETLVYVSHPYTWEGMPYESLVANIELCNHLTTCGNTTVGPLYLYFPTSDRRSFADAKIYICPHPLEKPMTEQETLRGCGALTCYHKGSFETGEEAYEKLYDYARTHAIALRGDSFERSVIDCWSTTQEEEFLLEIILPTTEEAPPQDLCHVSF